MKQTFIENTEGDILGQDGGEDFNGIRIIESSKQFDIFIIYTLNGFGIACTPEHILYTKNNEKILAKDITNKTDILTIIGLDRVSCINKMKDTKVYDIINTSSHNTITNGIISHNCDEFAHVPKNQCIDGDEHITLFHNEEEKKVSLRNVYNALTKAEYHESTN